MNTIRIAIIGLGSRGLSVLEQFIALSREHPQLALQLELFDPQTPGSGLHHAEQPDHLMLNTMAGQLSAFCTAHPASQPPGPTFLQWCQAQDLRLDTRGHLAPQGTGRPIGFGDFVPRRLLGRYLRDAYQWLLAHCPASLKVLEHRQRVCRVRPALAGPGWVLDSEQGEHGHFDGLFITTGHAPSLPLTEPGERVAIEGLGLTAMDTLAALTEGRGGRFCADHSLAGWRYQPSGREPRIWLFSRSGLPFHARPQGAAAAHLPWPRLFFTVEAIDALRRQAPDGQLDFAVEVLPLIEQEMRAVFYQASVQRQAPDQLAGLQQALRDTRMPEVLFAELAQRWGAFEPARWLAGEGWSGQGADYAAWFRQWIEHDLRRSRLGEAGSPLTQALEVWRDCRDLLRRVVDHDGLHPASTQAFYQRFAGLSNRLVGGPQKERYEDLLALLDAGVVQVLPPCMAVQEGQRVWLRPLDGSQPALEVDSLIHARNAHSGLSQASGSLLGDLLQQGLIRAAHPYPADGVAVDPAHRALHPDGTPHPRLWLLGPAVEGSTFYNHYVPTPDPRCLAPLQARQAVQDCLASLAMPCALAG